MSFNATKFIIVQLNVKCAGVALDKRSVTEREFMTDYKKEIFPLLSFHFET